MDKLRTTVCKLFGNIVQEKQRSNPANMTTRDMDF